VIHNEDIELVAVLLDCGNPGIGCCEVCGFEGEFEEETGWSDLNWSGKAKGAI
jgi:hypothetical protein